MKLKVLVDNNTYIDEYYCGEPAVSYYIEDEERKILFDTGYSDLFIKNAHAFGIPLDDLDAIVISHGHDDHTRGLKFFFDQIEDANVEVIAHPDAFNEKTFGDLMICSPILTDELSEKCKLILSSKPLKVSENIIFLGEIPQANSFEQRKPIGHQSINNIKEVDFVLDDSALVYKCKDGIYIITGCSHSGICNIIEYAKRVSNEERVLGIIGGFHLFEVNEQLHETIQYLKNNNIELMYPCHCTSFAVKAEIHKVIPVEEVGVGLELNW